MTRRLGDDLQIEPQTPVVDVSEVVFDPGLHRIKRLRRTPQSVYLRPTGNTRLNFMTPHAGFHQILVVLVVSQRMGPRTDDRRDLAVR
jgi:hypothetical protein